MRTILNLALVLVLGCSALGQISDDRTADEIVRDFNLSSLKQDWTGMTSLFHPDSLKELRALFAAMADKPAIAKGMFGVRSKAEFDALPDSQLFERLFGTLKSISPEMDAALKSMELIVVGSVDESPDLRHVVYRANFNFGQTPISALDVYTLKRFQNTWRVLMKEDQLRAMAAGIAAAKQKPAPVKKAPPKIKKSN